MGCKEQGVSSQSLPIKEADDSAVDDRSVATIGYVGETFEQHFAAVRGAAMQNKYWVSVSPDHLQSCNARESPGHAVYIKYNIVMDPDSTARFPVLNSPHVTIMYQCPCEDLAVLWQAKSKGFDVVDTPVGGRVLRVVWSLELAHAGELRVARSAPHAPIAFRRALGRGVDQRR